MSGRALAAIASALALCGCITPQRLAGPPPAPASAILPGFAAGIRASTQDIRTADDLTALRNAVRAAVTDGSLDILALSGGGAGGAYGAGALVGLDETGGRPTFEIVTGVSTGALIAPFAFLGPDWDGALEEAYTGPLAENLLRRRGLSVLSQPGLFLGDPLRDLVEHFVTPELIAAVAEQSRRGRLLLVQTTNLDTQDPIIWNLGEIAERGGDPARRLFVDVLVASASVPGVFPPVMIDVDAEGRRMQEMHVDGGVTSSFFVMPQIIAMWSDEQVSELRGGNIYVIINGQLDNSLNATPLNTVPIVSRSFETSQMFQARATLALTEEFARRNHLRLRFTRIPRDYNFRGPLEFHRDDMVSLFAFGRAQAEEGHLWTTPDDFVEQLTEEPAPAPGATSVNPDNRQQPLR